MDEENNNNNENNESKEKINKFIRGGIKAANWIRNNKKKVIIGGIILLVILAFLLISELPGLIIEYLISLFNPTQSASSSTNEINQTSSIIYIDEDSGAYKLQDNFSEKLLEELERQSVNAEAAGFVTEDLEDMLDKYIKAEVQTMFPKTGVWGNDVDGLITVQRASTDTERRNYKD